MGGLVMDDSLQCGKCGYWVHAFLRCCPECGEPVFLTLDKSNARPELFFDLMTSLFNLVADKSNSRRERYLPQFSEDTIFRRCEIEFAGEAHCFALQSATEDDWPEEIQDLFAMTLTNTLVGYVYRSVEEFVTSKKTEELQPAEKDYLMASLGKEDLDHSCYRLLSAGDELDRRVLFCLALRLDSSHIMYKLADSEQQKEWYFSVIEQSLEKTIQFYKIACRALWPKKDLGEFLESRQEVIRENVEKDFLFGYVVKLSESLNPYKPKAPRHLH